MKTRIFSPTALVIIGLLLVKVDFPAPIGHVNDFANLLSAGTKQELETKLSQYAKDTGIEVAVVTVNSLEGLTIEEYTITLAQKWGVGGKQKDNGVVLLVAPNERELRIEVGYGLETNLTDVQAGRIIQDSIIPLFKQNQMSDSVVAGANSILKQLGKEPFAQRLEERAKEEQLRKERADAVFKGLILFIVSLFGLIGVTFLVIKSRARYLSKKELRKEINKTLDECYAKLLNVKETLAEAKENLQKQKAEGRKGLDKLYEALPTMEELGLSQRALGIILYDKKRSNFFPTLRRCKVASQVELLIIKDWLEGIYNANYEYARWKEAREKSPILLRALPNKIESAKRAVDHPDVSLKTKDMIVKVESKIAQAKEGLKQTPTDWLLVFNALSGAVELAKNVMGNAQSEKEYAVEAREESPKLIKAVPDIIKNAEGAVSHSDVSKKTRDLLTQAKKHHESLKSMVESSSVINWLVIFASVKALLKALELVLQDAEKDKRQKNKEREEEQKKRYSASSTTSRGGGGSISGPSSPRGGGGFGGFGGGSFGGGGASGKW